MTLLKISAYKVLLFWISTGILVQFPNQSIAQNNVSDKAETIERIIAISEQAIANPTFLETKEWKNFRDVIRSDRMVHLDDEEFAREFNRAMIEADLPFTHYRLIYQSGGIDENGEEAEQPAAVEITEIDHETILLVVRIFEMAEEVMINAIRQIESGGYKNLIIDLRGNQGGSFPSVVILGRYLTDQAIDAGVYLTRQWFEIHGDYPTQKQLADIPVLQDFSLEGFTNLLWAEGAARQILPPHSGPIFHGDLYILTDRNTASAGEPFVYFIKQNGAATIVGERTAGSMLSGERIPVNENFTLFLPVADYMTADGHRIDRVGVEPDIEVSSKDALKRTLEIITEH